MIPPTVQATGAMWYANVTITATLALTSSVVCTYQSPAPQVYTVDLAFQSCTGGKGIGDFVPTSSVTLSGLVGGAAGTAGLDATLSVTTDDGSACTYDSCLNGVVQHSYAPEGTSCSANICTDTSACNATGQCIPSSTPPAIDDHDVCTLDSCSPSTGVTHTYTCTPPNVPADAGSDPTVSQDFAKNVEFFYTGGGAQQTGVDAGAMDAKRATVIRGAVYQPTTSDAGVDAGADRDPLLGVTVSILNHPEFGSTLTRNDGHFELVANGGDPLTVQFSLAGYLVAQRSAETRWHDWTIVDDVVLIHEAALSAAVPADAGAWSYVKGPPVTDSDGTRTPTLIIPSGTTVIGWTPPSGQFQFRMTEYTVGSTGPAAMPGSLPPQSAYTYAVEMKIEGAPTPTTFNQKVILYVDNFNGTLMGTTSAGRAVPSGYYDRSAGVWKAEESGQIVKILSINNGKADLSLDGTNAELSQYGITDPEREQVAAAYDSYPFHGAGMTFWRVRLAHFTTYDLNWGSLPVNAEFPPKNLKPESSAAKPNPCINSGSIIECENGVLGESIGLTGTPFDLHYRSETQDGFKTQIKVPYSGSAALLNSTDFVRVEVEVDIQGKRYSTWIAPYQKNGFATFDWDRRDAANRPVLGTVDAHVRVAYVYKAKSGDSYLFGQSPGQQMIVGDRAERVIKMERYFYIQVGAFDARPQGLGGWTVGLQHVLDAEHGIVWHGDGTKQTLSPSAKVLRTEGAIPAAQSAPLAAGGDGSVYGYANSTVYRIANGSAVALGSYNATDNSASIPNGSPFVNLKLAGGELFSALGATRDGGFLLAYNGSQIFRVGPAPSYLIQSIYGPHQGVLANLGNDGMLAAGAPAVPYGFDGVAEGPDGSVYFIGYSGTSVRRILPNGQLETVAGSSTSAATSAGCRAPAPTGCIAKSENFKEIRSLAVGPDGSVYFSSYEAGTINGSIWRVTPDGRLSLAAGSSGIPPYPLPEGKDATSTYVVYPTALAWGEGRLYYVDLTANLVRAIEPEGRVVTVAGGNPPRNVSVLSGDGEGAFGANIRPKHGLAVGPNGAIHFSHNGGVTFRIDAATRQLTNGDHLVPSPDGSDVYRFDLHGRHQETLTGARGKSRWQFLYDPQGRLSTVRDSLASTAHRDTTLAYSSSGFTITSPWNVLNTATVDSSGYLLSVSEPETSFAVTHSLTGLLTSFKHATGAPHTFAFTPSGRLANDKDGTAMSPGITLQRTDALTSYTSEITTAEGRKTTHIVDVGNDTNDPAVVELRRHIDPNGLETKDARNADGSRKVTLPDGTTTTSVFLPDPRYGSAAPFVSSRTTTSGSKSVAVTQTSAATLADATDPRTLSMATTTSTFNGKIETTTFTVNLDGTSTVETTSPVGRKSRKILDEFDRVKRIEPVGTFPGLNSTTVTPNAIDIVYDAAGNIGTVTQGARTTTFTYEVPTGFLSSVVGPLGTTGTTYLRADGLPKDTTFPGGRTVTASWNDRGNLTSLKVPRNSTTSYQHDFALDLLDRLSSYQPPYANFTPKDTGRAYDTESAVVSVNQPTGSAVIERDFGGRETKVSFPDPLGMGTRSIENTYNAQRVNTVVSKLNGNADATLTYGYDGLMILSEQFAGPFLTPQTVNRTYDALMRPLTRNLDAVAATSATYEYDDDSVVKKVTLNGIPYAMTRELTGNAVLKTTSAGAVTDTYEYDAYGSVVHYQVKTGSTVVYDVVYDRSAFTNQPSTGRVKSKTEMISGLYNTACVTNYTYNAQNFLATSARTGGCGVSSAGYSYDLAGNRDALPYDSQDRLLTDSYGWNHQYTNDGAMSGLESGGTTYYGYQYDIFGNMRRMSHYWGGDVRYVIDGLGRRIARTNANGSLINGYLYDGDHIVGETNAGSNVIAHFLYINRTNVPDFMVRKDLNGVWQTYRLISDQTGNPKLLIQLGSNTIVERYDWDDWGVAVGGGAWPGTFHPFGFQGGLWDASVGLYRFGTRDYRPFEGRWWSKDSAGFSGGFNLYAFAANDPVNYVDPSGAAPSRSSTDTTGTFWDGVVGSITNAVPSLHMMKGGLALRQRGLLMMSHDDTAQAGLDLYECSSRIVAAGANMVATDAAVIVGVVDFAANAAKLGVSGASSVKPPRGGGYVNHHVLPRNFVDKFEKAGMNIEEWYARIPWDQHQSLHSGYAEVGGLGRGGAWNTSWKVFFDEHPGGATAEQIGEHAFFLMDRFEITMSHL